MKRTDYKNNNFDIIRILQDTAYWSWIYNDGLLTISYVDNNLGEYDLDYDLNLEEMKQVRDFLSECIGAAENE